MGRGLESSTVSAALARLLLLSMSIGILAAAAASAQEKPRDVLPPTPAPGGGVCGDKRMTCSFKCTLLGCLVGCLSIPTILCSAMCYFENVSCQVGCTLSDIRRPPSPAEP